MGGAFGAVAIYGKIEFFAFLIYLPLIIDFLFKARVSFSTREKGDSTINGDDTLTPAPYPSLTHMIMSRVGTERKLVFMLWMISVLFGIMALTFSIIAINQGLLQGGWPDFWVNMWGMGLALCLPVLVFFHTVKRRRF
jgi:UDP-N-acetylmuramyl pentapeptide phosphotransferase/UDP-N-acetylglucosamine-1-phosphate transferase